MHTCLRAALCAALLTAASCSDDDQTPFSSGRGRPYLELTGVQTYGPTRLTLLFSEKVASTPPPASAFTVANASTGALLPVASAAAAGQSVSLVLAPPAPAHPYALVAGHVYDITYTVVTGVDAQTGASSAGEPAEAAGTRRFLADYLPPVPNVPAARQDSAGRAMVVWTPDNRVGNTGYEVWGKDASGTATLLASLPVLSGRYLLPASSGAVQAALKAVNAYGSSDLTAWTGFTDAGVAAFPYPAQCLAELPCSAPPPGYAAIVTSCAYTEYADSASGALLIRSITASGIRIVETDGTGAVVSDTVLATCP